MMNVKDKITLALDNSLNMQVNSGAIMYSYEPIYDRFSPNINFVRLAGCAYSIARAFSFGIKSRFDLKLCAEKLIYYLLIFLTPSPRGEGRYIREPGYDQPFGKLGATALTALAIQFLTDEKFKKEYDALISTLISMQNNDGSFVCLIGKENESGSLQNYFPGEALLALVGHVVKYNDGQALVPISKAFPFYVNHFTRDPKTSFILWQADAWSRVAYAAEKPSSPDLLPHGIDKETVSKFVFYQIDWFLGVATDNNDLTKHRYDEAIRRFSVPNINTACHAEAIACALRLAIKMRDDQRVDFYRIALDAAMNSIFLLQISSELSKLYRNPSMTIGAVRQSMNCVELRCDHNQHFITAGISYMEAIGEIS